MLSVLSCGAHAFDRPDLAAACGALLNTSAGPLLPEPEEYDRASSLMVDRWVTSGHTHCCNHWSNATGTPQLHCLRGAAGAYLSIYLGLLVGGASIVACLFACTHRSRWRAVRMASRGQGGGGAGEVGGAGADHAGGGDDSASITGDQMKLNQEELALRILRELEQSEAAVLPRAHQAADVPPAAGERSRGRATTKNAAQRRWASFLDVQRRFGFQSGSTANQHEHLTSLLVSFMSRTGGNYESAVLQLHAKLLRGAERWRENVHNTRASAYLTYLPETASDRRRRPYVKLAAPTPTSLRARTDSAGVVTELGTYGSWVHLSIGQMEEELVLFLCVWGEASSLRFCPEVVFFVFELVRSHYRMQSQEESGMGSTAGVLSPSEEGDFLSRVVQPIYTELRRERQSTVRTLPSEKRNYDDFNEAFWT
jgi:hypothetical protein